MFSFTDLTRRTLERFIAITVHMYHCLLKVDGSLVLTQKKKRKVIKELPTIVVISWIDSWVKNHRKAPNFEIF